jgi:hypothetical protein
MRTMHAWELYYEDFRRHATRADAGTFERPALLAEAAHEAYRHTADALARDHGWPEERALVVTRGMNDVVRRWIDDGAADWPTLRESLRQSMARWE